MGHRAVLSDQAMQVSQLIYGSTGQGNLRGYQLLGRSPGVSDSIAREFCRWAPSHDSLQRQATTAWSLNFFPLAANTWVIARSTYGGPEYSGRGGMQIVTVALLLDHEQFAAYENHPVDVARTAMALGHLILPKASRGALPVVSLPSIPFFANALNRESAASSISDLVRSVADGQRAYLLCNRDPIDVLDEVFQRLDPITRRNTSFVTGLKPSVHRDVQLQFMLDADDFTTSKLQSHGRRTLRVE
jgi:hypothetical protein